MIERCPCCHARLNKTPSCPRCLADLSRVINAEKAAGFWLSKAVQFLSDNKLEKSSLALKKSLQFKSTDIAIIFQDFLIYQQSQLVLALLEKSQLLSAKQILYQIRPLTPQSKQLQELNSFTDYLLLNP